MSIYGGGLALAIIWVWFTGGFREAPGRGFSRRLQKTSYTFPRLKYHSNAVRPGLCPKPRRGSSQCPQDFFGFWGRFAPGRGGKVGIREKNDSMGIGEGRRIGTNNECGGVGKGRKDRGGRIKGRSTGGLPRLAPPQKS